MQTKFINNLTITRGTAKEKQSFHTALAMFNNALVPYSQKKNKIRLNYVIKDANALVLAGISGVYYNWKILHITHLWVHQDHRRQKLGSSLLKKVEEEAKKFGCPLIHVETYSFQAEGFYLKMGFNRFGVLLDCPPGHTKYFLKKEI